MTGWLWVLSNFAIGVLIVTFLVYLWRVLK
jgi:hypothetical protein